MAHIIDISGTLPDKVRHWYLCGADRGLVLGAFHELRAWLGVDASAVAYMDGQEVSEQEVAEFLAGSGSLPGQPPALLVLENADAIDFSFLNDHKSAVWTDRLLAIGSDKVVTSTDARHAYFFKRQSGTAVVCRPPSRERLMVWVQKRLGCGADVAATLVDCSGGDTMWLAREVNKLVAVGVGTQLMSEHIYKVTSPTAQGDLVAALLEGNKPAALECIPSPQAAPVVLRRLEELVLHGSLVYEAQTAVGWSSRLLSKRTGLGVTELGTLKKHVNSFARQPTERRLRALARVSTRALRGERQAWLSLVALW